MMNLCFSTIARSLASIVLIAAFTGCSGALKEPVIVIDDQPRNRSPAPYETKRLAVGAKLLLRYVKFVREYGLNDDGIRPINLKSVTSSNPDVIEVVEFAPPGTEEIPHTDLGSEERAGAMTLRAVGSGKTTIEVVGEDGSTASFEVKASEPARLKFAKGPCLTGWSPVLIGQQLELRGYSLYDAQNRFLHYLSPQEPRVYEIRPEGAISDDGVVEGPPGDAEIVSLIDDNRWRLEIISAAAIETLELKRQNEEIGLRNSFVLYGMADGRDVCRRYQHDSLTFYLQFDVEVHTPDVCSRDVGDENFEKTLFFAMKQEGTCRFSVHVPEARDGQGLTVTEEFEYRGDE